jgi:antitoxin component of RelBE/YafQ-DinJ toxin-antitoxin module
MSKSNRNYTIVGASISPAMKAAMLRELDKLDMSPSELIRLSVAYLVEHGRLPFEVEPHGSRYRAHVPTRVDAGRETVAAV